MDVLEFLKAKGFKYKQFEDGFFWYWVEWPPQADWGDIFQVDESLENFTYCKDGWVNRCDFVEFAKEFNRGQGE